MVRTIETRGTDMVKCRKKMTTKKEPKTSAIGPIMKSVFNATWEFQRHLVKRRLARSSGFTLLELLVAMCIAGIVCVSLYAGLAQSFNSVQSSRHRLRATQILTEKLEVIRLYNWAQINTPGFVPTTFKDYYQPSTNGNPGVVYTGSIIITNAPVQPAYTNTMRKAVMQVSWVSGVVTQQLRIETLISQYGVQNYIY
jgi:prepilin-type N-terminal cleavage/methylation domain-containing protein